MKRPLKYLFIFTGLLSGSRLMAQADISMATHWNNRANYNPASIARTNYLYVFTNVRQQWLGVSGAPKVFNIQASDYIHHLHSAFGVSLVGDNIGVTQFYNPMFTYAYRISDERNWQLSMGLSAGIFSRTINGSLFEAETTNDPSIQYDKQSTVSPDANVGLEFQTTYFIMGLSTTHLLALGKSADTYLNTNHRYGYLIYKNFDPDYFNYNIGVQVVNRQNLTVVEGNANVRFKNPTGLMKGSRELFDVGMTYRSTKQMTLLLGVNVTPDLRAGYAYDHSFSPGLSANWTHELMLEWRIPSRSAATKFICGNKEFWYR